MTEKDVERKIILYASQCGCTLFKNEMGVGKSVSGNTIKYGLCNGSSDLIGWTPITITEDMVGSKVAVFTAVEVKLNKHGKYKATESQKLFISAVLKNGGYAGVADCNEDFEKIVNKVLD